MVGKPPSRYILTHTLAPIGDSQVRMLGYTCPPFIFVPPCLTMYFFVALASHVELKEAGANCTSSNVTFHKSIQGDHWGPNDTFDKSVQGDPRGPVSARAEASEATVVVEKYSVNDVSKDQLCFLTAVSSNHLHTANAFLKSIQKFYPCGKTYVYDLGLKGWEKQLLKALPYVEDVMELVLPVRGKDYFPSGSCAFKPPMMLQFINKYLNNETNCRFTFYGDSVIFFHHKFNRKAFDEVKRLGEL